MSSRVSGARVSARMFAPPESLSDVVERFWVGAWDLTGQDDHHVQLIGDPAVNLVFEDGRSRVVGVWTKLWTRTLTGRGEVRAVKLHPGAAQAFLSTEAWTLSNRITPLDELCDGTEALTRAVLSPEEPADGLAILSDWLCTRRRGEPQVAQAVRLVAHLREEKVTRVDALAAHAGMSVRSLQRLFRAHVGATPKWVVRWTRLQEVAVRVEAGKAIDLAGLAYSLGYADQAHLARDFRAATGQTLRGFEEAVHT